MSEHNYRAYREGDAVRAKRSEQGLRKGGIYRIKSMTMTSEWGVTIRIWMLESLDGTERPVVASPLDLVYMAPHKYQR